MKVGTIVECVNDKNIDNRIENKPKEKKYYTVRAVIPNMGCKKGLLLEEIVNKLIEHPSGLGKFEPNFSIERFAEVNLPESILEEVFNNDLCEL